MPALSIVAATGMLGSGYREDSLVAALDRGAAMIGCDAGTTDGGPSYLATGTAAFSEAALARDIGLMIRHGVGRGVPVVIGSAGMSGCDAGVDLVAGIVRRTLARHGLGARLALIRSEMPAAALHGHRAAGRVAALAPAAELSAADIDQAIRIVGVMGVEPIQAALDAGAGVVVAGRCTDAAIYAALPLMRGYEAGPAWHLGKILECGAAAVEQRSAPDCMLGTLDGDGFVVEPLRTDYRCTPQSVASHALYETADPMILTEPSGTLRLEAARYHAASDRAVRVRGSAFVPAARHSVKVEGVRLAGYSTIVLGSIRDPYILATLDDWLARLDGLIRTRLGDTGAAAKFQIVTRVYGRDGTCGPREPRPVVEGHEVAILWDVIAETQALAASVATSLSHLALHNPVAKWAGLITGVAIPFSPNTVDRGPVHEFHLNHVVFPDSPVDPFPMEIEDVRAPAHA